MKNAKIVLISSVFLSCFSLTAYAGEKLLSIEGRDVTYIERIDHRDGTVTLSPATVFIGRAIIEDEDNRCREETSSLLSIEHNPDGSEEPHILIEKRSIQCPEKVK